MITGASAGIGAELAVLLAGAGAKLTLAARRLEKLEAVAQRVVAAGYMKPVCVACDVARDGELECVVSAAVSAWGKLDIAIANAGFGVKGPITRLSIEDYRRQFETNVFGVLRTIYASLPEITKAKGNIAIVGSVAGWVASPGGSPYSMSKFALRGLADAITPELRRAGVTVTLVSPGFVESDFRGVDNQNVFHPEAEDSAPAWLRMPTTPAARDILKAVARGKREVIITGHGKILVLLQRFTPWIIRALSNRFAPGTLRT